MNKAVLMFVGSGLMAVTLLCGKAHAQQMIAVSQVDPPVNVSTSRQALRSAQQPARITLAMSRTSLEAVLREIARQGNMELSFVRSDVNVQRSVDIHVSGVSVLAALQAALKGSGMNAQISSDGETIVVRPVKRDAQAEGVIVGRVLHATTKQPIAGATVTVDQAGTSVRTAEDGSFRITVPAGDHTISVRGVGMARQNRRVTVVNGESVSVELVLEPSASVLDEVVVTGTVVATARKEIATPITVITAQDLERQGITRIDQLFRGQVPGVLKLDRGTANYVPELGAMVQSEVYARGSSDLNGNPNPLKTYVDGVELMDASYLGSIDPRSVERIEILTGPQAAAIYGSGALGGVMQIFTKRGNDSGTPEIRWSGKYGMLENSLSTGRTPSHDHLLEVTGRDGSRFSYTGTVTYNYVGQWQPGLFNRRVGTSAGISHTSGPMTVNGTVALTQTTNGTSYGAGVTNLRFKGDMAKAYAGYAEGVSRQKISRGQSMMTTVNADLRPVRWWQAHATIGRNQMAFDMDPIRPMFGTPADTVFDFSSSTGTRTSGNANMTFAPPAWRALTQVFTLGMTVSAGRTAQMSGSGMSKRTTSYVSPQVSKSTPDKSWGGFGTLRWGVFDQLFLTLGVRGERNAAYGQDHKVDWTPTNGLTYTIDAGAFSLKLLASYGSATRAPTATYRDARIENMPFFFPNNIEVQAANPELAPEYERGPQGGFELYVGNRFSVTVNHYRQKVTNLIQTVNWDSTLVCFDIECAFGQLYWPKGQWQNIGDIKKRGWEATGSFAWNAFTWQGTYSWSDSRIERVNDPANTNFYPGSSFPGVPTHTGHMQVGYARGKTSLHWSTQFLGASNVSGDNNLVTGVLAKVWTPIVRPDGLDNARISAYLERHRYVADLWIPKRAYHSSNLVVQQRMTDRIGFTMNITNVENTYQSEAIDAYATPALGRQALFGVDIRFGGR